MPASDVVVALLLVELDVVDDVLVEPPVVVEVSALMPVQAVAVAARPATMAAVARALRARDRSMRSRSPRGLKRA